MVTGIISPDQQQEVSDAALPLMMLRRRAHDRWLRTREPGTESYRVELVPPSEVGDLVLGRCQRATHLVSTTRWMASTRDLVTADHNNRDLVFVWSLRMTSYFDAGSVSPEMIRVLGSSPGMPYHVAFGPMQMKLFDHREVLVAGPDQDGLIALLWLHGAPAVRAAQHYLAAVRRTAVPAVDLVAPDKVCLTPRQHAVARLLTEGLRDTDAAARLGVSLRTFRAEVARILDELGCETRFAAGARYSVWASSQVDARP